MPKRSIYFSLLSLALVLSTGPVQAYYPDMGADQPNVTYGHPVEDKIDLCLRHSVQLYNQIRSKLTTQKQIDGLNNDLQRIENCLLRSEYLQNVKSYLDKSDRH